MTSFLDQCKCSLFESLEALVDGPMCKKGLFSKATGLLLGVRGGKGSVSRLLCRDEHMHWKVIEMAIEGLFVLGWFQEVDAQIVREEWMDVGGRYGMHELDAYVEEPELQTVEH